MTLREAIQDISKDKLKSSTIRLASVVSVEGETCTVMMLDSETEISGVRIQIDPSSGILYTPSVGSNVLLARISDFDFGVLMFSELESIKFLDGSFGGVVKVIDLVDKLNAIENKINALIAWGVTVSPAFSPATPLTPTIRADIENTGITHGTV